MSYIFLVLEIICIVAAVVIQIKSFSKSKKRMEELSSHAKSAFSNLRLESILYEGDELDDPEVMKSLINCKEVIKSEEDDDSAYDNVEEIDLISSPVLSTGEDNEFAAVIRSTNGYLIKNKGITSDFGILQNICERRIESEDTIISESLSTPLYVGLCGTFVGIVCGVFGLLMRGVDNEGLNSILLGVAIAMIASLLGLALTTINKVKNYPEKMGEVEKAKNDYYDFLQKELMPSLSLGVAGSLATFKDVLGNFISKFGSNINGYAESARLLNENIKSEHLLIREINNLNITKTSKAIAESFATLKESSEDLKHFKDYQDALNQTIDKATAVTSKMEGIINTFEGFVTSLSRVASQTNETNELQKKFKESLEVHFPTIQDHETVWRAQIDEISKDTKQSSTELQEYLRSSSEYIRNFVADNSAFISGLVDMKDAVAAVKRTTENQTAMYDAYKTSMDSLKQSIDKLYDREADNQNNLVLAIKGLLEKNDNPQYSAKLQEIATVLGDLQAKRNETLNEAKTTLTQIKQIVEAQDTKVNSVLSDQGKKIEAVTKQIAEVKADVKKVEKEIK